MSLRLRLFLNDQPLTGSLLGRPWPIWNIALLTSTDAEGVVLYARGDSRTGTNRRPLLCLLYTSDAADE